MRWMRPYFVPCGESSSGLLPGSMKFHFLKPSRALASCCHCSTPRSNAWAGGSQMTAKPFIVLMIRDLYEPLVWGLSPSDVCYGGLHTIIAICMSARRHAYGTPCSVSSLHLPSACAFLLLHVMRNLSSMAIVLRLRLPLVTVHSPLPLLVQGPATGTSMQVGTSDLSMPDTGAAAVTLPRLDLILLGLASPLPNAVWALNLRRIERPSGSWPGLRLKTRRRQLPSTFVTFRRSYKLALLCTSLHP